MSDTDCLFCKIVDGDLPADIVYENDSLIAFRDIDPKAPTHILLIPRRHIATMNDLQGDDKGLVGELFVTATESRRRRRSRRRRLSRGHELQ